MHTHTHSIVRSVTSPKRNALHSVFNSILWFRYEKTICFINSVVRRALLKFIQNALDDDGFLHQVLHRRHATGSVYSDFRFHQFDRQHCGCIVVVHLDNVIVRYGLISPPRILLWRILLSHEIEHQKQSQTSRLDGLYWDCGDTSGTCWYIVIVVFCIAAAVAAIVVVISIISIEKVSNVIKDVVVAPCSELESCWCQLRIRHIRCKLRCRSIRCCNCDL
mmetsp:Transcript_18614/g.53116  ORF Transcript_18614/g.53116 Transcript_18614/m.53116 type:complete len:220 (+) Transcript_18614:132-791(+)